ncbi:MAG: histidinol-phosphatase [Rhizobiaceae bacterium]
MDIADFLFKLADVAAKQTLPRFRTRHDVVNKYTVGFDPVTEADREAERAIRAEIKRAFPGHGIIGEEFGAENERAEHVWVIDPIDGTRAFISGIPLWGTLVGLMRNGRAIAGVMAQPFTGEMYFADGKSSRYRGPDGDKLLKTSSVKTLGDAILFTTTPALFKDDKRVAYDRLEQAVKLARYGTDCYGYAMVAAGNAELVCECGLQTYDVAALIPIVEQAGGMMTDWSGGRAENGGFVLASANAALHEAAISILAG